MKHSIAKALLAVCLGCAFGFGASVAKPDIVPVLCVRNVNGGCNDGGCGGTGGVCGHNSPNQVCNCLY